MIDRRRLLAGLAVVAATVAAGSKAAGALSLREEFYLAEHRWASEAMMRFEASHDFLAWVAGTQAESPARWRLARRVIELEAMPDKSPIEQTLSEQFVDLWGAVTRDRPAYAISL